MIEGYSGDETKGSNQDPKEKSITDNTLEQVVFHKITGMDDIEKKMDIDSHSKLIKILTGIEDTQQKMLILCRECLKIEESSLISMA